MLRRFEVDSQHGRKFEAKWEGPYRLDKISWHGKTGRVFDLKTGLEARKGPGALHLFSPAFSLVGISCKQSFGAVDFIGALICSAYILRPQIKFFYRIATPDALHPPSPSKAMDGS